MVKKTQCALQGTAQDRKTQVRAKFEHLLRVIKRQFDYVKTRFRPSSQTRQRLKVELFWGRRLVIIDCWFTGSLVRCSHNVSLVRVQFSTLIFYAVHSTIARLETQRPHGTFARSFFT